jgi:hypothetical protein
MPKYVVTATLPTHCQAIIEADDLGAAKLKAESLKLDSYTQHQTPHVSKFIDNIYPVIEEPGTKGLIKLGDDYLELRDTDEEIPF